MTTASTVSWGYDYAYFTPPSTTWLHDTGASFVCRYVVPGNPKSLQPPEAAQLEAEGIAIVSNWEGDGYTEVLAGYDSGIRVATLALQQHEACGGTNKGTYGATCIYFSVDSGQVSAAQAEAYFQGINSVLHPRGYRSGAYGSYAVVTGLLAAGVIDLAWQTYAWSAGQWASAAVLRQYLNGGQYDHDEATALDFGQWGIAAPTPPGPAQTAWDLLAGSQLVAGQRLTSNGGRFVADMQVDGNFVVYDNNEGHRPIWASATGGHPGAHLCMQRDGNLVIYAGTQPLWQAGSDTHGIADLVMQEDGNLVVYSRLGHRPVWASRTAGQ